MSFPEHSASPENQSPPPPTLRLVDDHHHPVGITSPKHEGLARARQYRRHLHLTDTTAIVLVVTASALLHLPAAGLTTPKALAHGVVAVLVAVIWLVSMGAFHTRDSRILSVGIAEYKRVVSACTMTFGLLAITFVITQAGFVRWYFIVGLPIGLALLLINRWIWRRWLVRQGRRGNALSQVIVTGLRRDVEYVIRQIASKSRAAYSVVGVVLYDGSSVDPNGPLGDIPTHGDLSAVSTTAAELGADAVIVAGTPQGNEDFVRNLAWDLEGTATELILTTSLANVAGPRIHVRPVEGLPLIHVEIPQFEGGRHLLKRGFDIVVSGISLLLLAPALAIIAVIVRLDSAGPALYSQQRVGRDGKNFTIWKFRTMVMTANDDLAGLLDRNDATGVLFKMKNDPRVTRIGRVLRKHSIDELPQLWNIFIGDMSIVGPRPPLPREVEGYEDHVHRRLYIRPGLTGMWQVNGRSTLSWEESVQLDLYYVENWSLVGDIVIMFRTVRQVSHPVGAY